MNKGTLYLVGLHIGNIDDVSKRTLNYIQKAKNLVIEREVSGSLDLPAISLRRTSGFICALFRITIGGPE